MKSIFTFLFLFLLIGIASTQPWLMNLPAKPANDLTLYDYQQAFESYWAPFQVDNAGFYEVNGVRKKAAGWKQFKRWEHTMKSLIDTQTGAFPKKSAFEIYQEYIKSNPLSSSARNANWTSLGPDYSRGGYSGVGRINCITFHPTDLNTYWIGAASGGVWMTSDDGENWTSLTDGIAFLPVSDIVIPPDYELSSTLYIATGDREGLSKASIGVLKSKDKGQTWEPTGLAYVLSENAIVKRLLIDPDNSQILIAATTHGVFKTMDGGSTWNQQLTSIEFHDMEFMPGNFSVLYGATLEGEIYYSPNAGTSWFLAYSELESGRTELAVTPADPNCVYAVVTHYGSGLKGIYKSFNQGASYMLVLDGNATNLLAYSPLGDEPGGQGWYDVCIAASPLDAGTVFVGGINTWRTTDGGASWEIVNHWAGMNVQAVHADKHALLIRSNGDVFECNDGGIYISRNNGDSWIDKTNGIAITQMYHLGVAQSHEHSVITGSQDNGSKAYSADQWRDVLGGDGMDCMIDYNNSDVQYASYQAGVLHRTDDNWQTLQTIAPDDYGTWVVPYMMDPLDPEIIYAGYSNLWKSYDRGDNWVSISQGYDFSVIETMAIAPSDNQTMYVYTSQIWKTTSGGSEWTNVSNNLPAHLGLIESIAIKHDDPNTVWLTISGFAEPGVFQSTDGGSTWQNISQGLPRIPVYSVVQNRNSISSVDLYAGTELGVFVKKGDDDWQPFNDGLPSVKISELEMYYGNDPSLSKLRAATWGRGLWESPVEYTSNQMVFHSATTYQDSIDGIFPNEKDVPILDVVINTNGNLSPFHATSFTFSTTGSTQPLTDINVAKVYYTGSSNVFSNANLFGNVIISPNDVFTIIGHQELRNGANHFWLTYDIDAEATIGNSVDGACLSIQTESTQSPIVKDPPGNRHIQRMYCSAGADAPSNGFIQSVWTKSAYHISENSSSGYSDFTNHQLGFEEEIENYLVVAIENPSINDEVHIWIDWNYDGDFNDTLETVFSSGSFDVSPYTILVTVPDGVEQGVTRLRVRLHNRHQNPNSSSCGNSGEGEVEDYSLIIFPLSSCHYLSYLSTEVQNKTGSYVDLENKGTIIAYSEFDNFNSDPQGIGFNFEYQCQTFTEFILNSNGFIKLGSIPPSSDLFFDGSQSVSGGPFNSPHMDDINLIIPFNHDLFVFNEKAEFKVHTSGESPYRVCTIQIKNIQDSSSFPSRLFDYIEFQIRLYETTNVIEFIYGDWRASSMAAGYKTGAIGIKGAGNLPRHLLVGVKPVDEPWSATEFKNRNYSIGESFEFTASAADLIPDKGRTFRFTPMAIRDLKLGPIYALGDASLLYSNPQQIVARISNIGQKDVSGVPVTLEISGANNFTQTKQIPDVNFRGDHLLTFDNFVPLHEGINHIKVLLPADSQNENNAATWIQNTNDFIMNYASSDSNSGAYGFRDSSGIFYSKYYSNSSAEVKAVTAFITVDSSNMGQHVFGIILDEDGNIVGKSDVYTILDIDLGTWHTFSVNFSAHISQGYFYAGLGAIYASKSYNALGVQDENPPRENIFYSSAIDGSGLQLLKGEHFTHRLMIGAILSPDSTVGITASNAYSKVNVYPNPVNDEIVVDVSKDDVKFRVDLINSMGQLVYVRSFNAQKATLPVRHITPGIYTLKIDLGTHFEFHKVVKQ